MLTHITILSLISIGICCTMWTGMVFERLGDMIEETVGEFWAKPLGKCYVCTSFWISLVIVACVGWPFYYAVAAMGLCATISLVSNE